MTTTNTPFHTRLAVHLIILFLLGWLIYYGSSILLPILFAITLAMLLLPVVQWLNRKGVKDVIAILLAISAFIIAVAGIIFFLSSQIAAFLKDLPAIKEKMNEQLASIQSWISENLNIDTGKQEEAAKKATSGQGQGGGMSGIATKILGSIAAVVLLPIYTFLILFYRRLLHQFFTDVFPSRNRKDVEGVLSESQAIVNGYMIGLLIEMAIVSVLNTVGFLVVGAPYPVFLAVLAAILNLVPYIGMLIASVICIAITLTGSDGSSAAIWVGVILVVVQFIDNNFIIPYIVSSKVKINALVSIIGVMIGGALAGVGGMFLSIPGLAVLKAVFDRVESLQPWGKLLGDEREKESKTKKKQTR
jgi:predicted PurR-regulated permease PerM